LGLAEQTVLYLQATKKARDKLGVGKLQFAEPGHTASKLGNWLVNVVPIADRYALLFMSSRALLSFPMLIGQKETGPEDMPAFLAHGVGQLLQGLSAPRRQVTELLADFDVVALCKATNRSQLALHAAVANDYLFLAEDAGPHVDIGSIVQEVNSTPREKLGWRTSLEVTQELLAQSEA
jgi:hypothetical protein